MKLYFLNKISILSCQQRLDTPLSDHLIVHSSIQSASKNLLSIENSVFFSLSSRNASVEAVYLELQEKL